MSDVLEHGTDLVRIETLAPANIFRPGGVEEILADIERRVRAEKVDISTMKGRKACASLARKVASSKTALDDAGKLLTEEWREKVNAVNAERRIIRERLDALAEDIRAPLTAWEDEERARIQGHEAAIAEMQKLSRLDSPDPSAAAVVQRIDALCDLFARQWQEFAGPAHEAYQQAVNALNAQRAAAVTREAVERAGIEAARAAERDRQEAEAKLRAAEEARVETERRAEAAAAMAERRAEEAAAAAVAAEARAAEAAVAAEARAVAERTAAVEAERRRISDEEARIQAEATKRAADAKHRGKINSAAIRALLEIGLSQEHAMDTVRAIAKGQVPRVSIAY